ncbi:MAG: hypothetical protein QNJ46_01695 [Leptolyngbyaceae cyanobacterium MO_188.B28]|nr:hypothetical protein [Leptolyngbyaceae cyanobacterium MO_188.B28]
MLTYFLGEQARDITAAKPETPIEQDGKTPIAADGSSASAWPSQ